MEPSFGERLMFFLPAFAFFAAGIVMVKKPERVDNLIRSMFFFGWSPNLVKFVGFGWIVMGLLIMALIWLAPLKSQS